MTELCIGYYAYINKGTSLHLDLHFSRHYVLRWQLRCFIEFFISVNLVENCHRSVVKVSGL